jgi:mannose-6-phosphate isomerase-like protein (cupin superfamily)
MTALAIRNQAWLTLSVYVVVRGSGRMKLDDEIVDLKESDSVRVTAGTWRGYEAGPEGLEILVIGAPNLGEDPRDDVDGRRDWWELTSRSHSRQDPG